jgi:hypothetical protein
VQDHEQSVGISQVRYVRPVPERQALTVASRHQEAVPARIVYAPEHGGEGPLARHIQALHAQDHSVFIVSTRLPGPVLMEALKLFGVDTQRVFILDAVGNPLEHGRGHDRGHIGFVPSPNLLELMVSRARTIIQKLAERKPHVILYDLDTLALYNPAGALEEVFRYIENTRTNPQTVIDYVLSDALRLDVDLIEFLRANTQGELHLGDVPVALKEDKTERLRDARHTH